jgi:hypothetical protein
MLSQQIFSMESDMSKQFSRRRTMLAFGALAFILDIQSVS